tara:strand:+ start:467 stop:979 length:513 start_codon:yes stop_codon:yes gene_type:complete
MTWESVLKSPIPTRLKRICNSAKTIYGYSWNHIVEDIFDKELKDLKYHIDPNNVKQVYDVENIKIGRMMKQDRENRLYDVIYLPNPKKVSRWQCNEFIKLLVTICENKEKYTGKIGIEVEPGHIIEWRPAEYGSFNYLEIICGALSMWNMGVNSLRFIDEQSEKYLTGEW